jgi:hypothetical protein
MQLLKLIFRQRGLAYADKPLLGNNTEHFIFYALDQAPFLFW